MSLTAASSSANPASSFSALWAHLQPVIHHLMATNGSEAENPPGIDYAAYANIHTSLFNYFANRCHDGGPSESDGHLPGHEVYNKLDEFFRDTCKGVLLAAPEDGSILVTYIVSAFQRYSKRAAAVQRLTSYINRYFVKRAIEEEKGWMNLEDAWEIARQNSPGSNGSGERTIAQMKIDSKLLALQKWGYEDGDTAMAEACAEAASPPERIVPILSLAHRRFRTEVFETLLVYPKSTKTTRPKKRLKAPTGPPPYRPKGRLARAVQAYIDPHPIYDPRPVLSALNLALSMTGVGRKTHIRKRLHHLLSTPEK